MPYTQVASVLCGRGNLTPILSPLLANRGYLIRNDSQSPTQVQYWGTIFQDNDDTSTLDPPNEAFLSDQLYRNITRVTSGGFNASNVGTFKIWIPRNYLFLTAIIRVYLVA